MNKLWTTILLIACATPQAMALNYSKPNLVFSSSDEQAHNMPANTVFTDRRPSINDHREIAITLGLVGGTYDSGVWVKSRFQEGVIIRSGAKESFSDVKINNHGDLAFTHQTLNGIKGVLSATGVEGQGYEITDHMENEEFYPYTSFNNLYLNHQRELFFTAKNFKGDLGIFNFNAEWGMDLVELQNQRSRSPKSFIFTPSYNDKGDVAYKAKIGKRGQHDDSLPDQIIMSKAGKKVVLVEDQDSNKESKWQSLRNNVAISNNESIAFIATDNEGEKLVLKESNGKEFVLAQAGIDLKEFSFFSIVINDKDMVGFRGVDNNGHHAIFVATKNGVTKALTQFDSIKLPWAQAQVAYGPYLPFGGSIDMNNHGDVIVNVGLANLDNTDDYGHGVVVIFAKQ